MMSRRRCNKEDKGRRNDEQEVVVDGENASADSETRPITQHTKRGNHTVLLSLVLLGIVIRIIMVRLLLLLISSKLKVTKVRERKLNEKSFSLVGTQKNEAKIWRAPQIVR